MTRWLFRQESGEPHAWTDDERSFWLAEGAAYWAFRDGEWLYRVGDSQPIGWFVDQWLFADGTGEPLFYFGS